VFIVPGENISCIEPFATPISSMKLSSAWARMSTMALPMATTS
jgi:hypothetical protein